VPAKPSRGGAHQEKVRGEFTCPAARRRQLREEGCIHEGKAEIKRGNGRRHARTRVQNASASASFCSPRVQKAARLEVGEEVNKRSSPDHKKLKDRHRSAPIKTALIGQGQPRRGKNHEVHGQPNRSREVTMGETHNKLESSKKNGGASLTQNWG